MATICINKVTSTSSAIHLAEHFKSDGMFSDQVSDSLIPGYCTLVGPGSGIQSFPESELAGRMFSLQRTTSREVNQACSDFILKCKPSSYVFGKVGKARPKLPIIPTTVKNNGSLRGKLIASTVVGKEASYKIMDILEIPQVANETWLVTMHPGDLEGATGKGALKPTTYRSQVEASFKKFMRAMCSALNKFYYKRTGIKKNISSILHTWLAITEINSNASGIHYHIVCHGMNNLMTPEELRDLCTRTWKKITKYDYYFHVSKQLPSGSPLFLALYLSKADLIYTDWVGNPEIFNTIPTMEYSDKTIYSYYWKGVRKYGPLSEEKLAILKAKGREVLVCSNSNYSLAKSCNSLIIPQFLKNILKLSSYTVYQPLENSTELKDLLGADNTNSLYRKSGKTYPVHHTLLVTNTTKREEWLPKESYTNQLLRISKDNQPYHEIDLREEEDYNSRYYLDCTLRRMEEKDVGCVIVER